MIYPAIISAIFSVICIICPSGGADQYSPLPRNIELLFALALTTVVLWIIALVVFIFRFKNNKRRWWALLLTPGIIFVAAMIQVLVLN